MASRAENLIEKSKQGKILSDAEMDYTNAQADIKDALSPTTIEDPNQEAWDEYLAAHRRLVGAYKRICDARDKIRALKKELGEE